MAHTHSFELDFDHVDVTGEFTFDNNGGPQIKFDDSIDVQFKEIKYIYQLFETLTKICNECGEITKIEINKK